jgi:hypothetical protein
MRKKRFSVEQMIGISKQAQAGGPVAELIRKAEIGEQTSACEAGPLGPDTEARDCFGDFCIDIRASVKDRRRLTKRLWPGSRNFVTRACYSAWNSPPDR